MFQHPRSQRPWLSWPVQDCSGSSAQPAAAAWCSTPTQADRAVDASLERRHRRPAASSHDVISIPEWRGIFTVTGSFSVLFHAIVCFQGSHSFPSVFRHSVSRQKISVVPFSPNCSFLRSNIWYLQKCLLFIFIHSWWTQNLPLVIKLEMEQHHCA